MADVTFTPTFKHTPWVDNRDRVQASGPNGFNVRFSSLETDLQTLSSVVGQIDSVLDTLGQAPQPQARVLTLPPMLSATTSVAGWGLDSSGYAVRPSSPITTLAGIAPVVIPNGVTLSAFRASGVNGGPAAGSTGSGTLRINLMRARLVGAPVAADRIARVTGDASPFDNSVATDPTMSAVDTTVFRYFVLATLDNAQTTDNVSLSGFQITYLA